MVIQLTLGELMVYLIYILGIVAVIFLISVLWNIKKLLHIVRPILEVNQDLIKKTIRTLPPIFENIEEISCNLRDTTDKLKVSAPVILGEVEATATAANETILTAQEIIENIGFETNKTANTNKNDKPGAIAYLHIAEEVLEIIYGTFSKKK